ncbi:hypothetical protein [Ureaplasma diversum]|uniref:Uncharacterized protein n=1 Tax=Ureaplasma diversum NCTC 246 TaxID=1188241 RepID=A0A084EVC7_9BACT|nr:hypothetical protein [Ureaplasma diversum]KEZ21919.1 hypothetical protein UDIV_7230 [Ureaplasma diversum NCTC 246]
MKNPKFNSFQNDVIKKLTFIVNTHTTKELLDLLEHLKNDKSNISIKQLIEMYSVDLINNSKIININGKYFVCHKNEYDFIKEHHKNTLITLSQNPNLFNPVYLELDENKALLVD